MPQCQASRALAAAVAIATALGCRSSIDSKNRRTAAPEAAEDPAPRGEPVEVPGSLGAARTHYQSRNTVTLDVDTAAIQLGTRFALLNVTSGATLIDHDESEQAALTSSLKFRLHLLDPEVAAGFKFGANELKLLVDGDTDADADGEADERRFALTTVTLHDFPAFAFTTGSFATGEQRAAGFQGGFEPFAKVIVTSPKPGFLATGFLSISNQ